MDVMLLYMHFHRVFPAKIDLLSEWNIGQTLIFFFIGCLDNCFCSHPLYVSVYRRHAFPQRIARRKCFLQKRFLGQMDVGQSLIFYSPMMENTYEFRGIYGYPMLLTDPCCSITSILTVTTVTASTISSSSSINYS